MSARGEFLPVRAVAGPQRHCADAGTGQSDLKILPGPQTDVQPDEAAVFTLNLYNESETEESRLYALRLLTTSNPHGAIVKVAGEPIMDGLQQYFIEPMQQAQGPMEAMLTVERGPTQYDYDSLAVIMYASCEYALWEQGGPMQLVDTAYFSVTFEDNGPLAFGTREPADGELSFGEDIAITFNEPIDCGSVEESVIASDITLTYLDGPSEGSAIALDALCDGRTIILNPTVSGDLLEGRRLRRGAGHPRSGGQCYDGGGDLGV